MPPNYQDHPYGTFSFQVILGDEDGAAGEATFAEASDPQGPLIEYRSGSEDIAPRKIPGLKKFTSITLKRGIVGDLAFWNWILKGMSGQLDRRDGTIVLRDEDHDEVMRWSFRRAWPTKWSGPGLTAKNNEIALETLEIQHEGLSIIEGPRGGSDREVEGPRGPKAPERPAAAETPAPAPPDPRERRREPRREPRARGRK